MLYSFVYLWFSAQQPVSDSGGHLDGAGRRLLTQPPIPDAQRPYPEGTAAGQTLVVGGTVNPADTHSISGEALISYLTGTYFKYWWPMPLFLFLLTSQIGTVPVLRRVHFIYSIFLGGCMVVWT